jgi:hypothetical protein
VYIEHKLAQRQLHTTRGRGAARELHLEIKIGLVLLGLVPRLDGFPHNPEPFAGFFRDYKLTGSMWVVAHDVLPSDHERVHVVHCDFITARGLYEVEERKSTLRRGTRVREATQALATPTRTNQRPARATF